VRLIPQQNADFLAGAKSAYTIQVVANAYTITYELELVSSQIHYIQIRLSLPSLLRVRPSKCIVLRNCVGQYFWNIVLGVIN
jgi:hypothetical protein